MELLVSSNIQVRWSTNHRHPQVQRSPPPCRLDLTINLLHVARHPPIRLVLHNPLIPVRLVDWLHNHFKTGFRNVRSLLRQRMFCTEGWHTKLIQILYARSISCVRLIKGTPYAWQYSHGSEEIWKMVHLRLRKLERWSANIESATSLPELQVIIQSMS